MTVSRNENDLERFNVIFDNNSPKGFSGQNIEKSKTKTSFGNEFSLDSYSQSHLNWFKYR